MSFKHHRHAKQQEERIRHIEDKLNIVREEIRVQKTRNVSSTIREQNNSESWWKPKNSKSICRRFSADDAVVELSERFSVLKTDMVNVDQHTQGCLGQGPRKIKSVTDVTGSRNKILLLGSSHARKTAHMIGKTLGKKFDIFGIVKPNAPLANVVENLGKLGKNCTNQNHIAIVRRPKNSLGRNYNYSIEDINFIAERTANTNMGFVDLLWRHDKLWMNRRVESMNLWLDWALIRRDISHINVIDASSFVREDFTRHSLHLNSQGKKRLMQLVAERVVDGQV
jgi:hypothetical protein